jgi:hypothetical protein
MLDAFKTNGASPPQRTDLLVENNRSICILRGMTDAGYAWVEEKCSNDG